MRAVLSSRQRRDVGSRLFSYLVLVSQPGHSLRPFGRSEVRLPRRSRRPGRNRRCRTAWAFRFTRQMRLAVPSLRRVDIRSSTTHLRIFRQEGRQPIKFAHGDLREQIPRAARNQTLGCYEIYINDTYRFNKIRAMKIRLPRYSSFDDRAATIRHESRPDIEPPFNQGIGDTFV